MLYIVQKYENIQELKLLNAIQKVFEGVHIKIQYWKVIHDAT